MHCPSIVYDKSMIKRKANLTEQEMLAIARAFAWYPNPSASFDGFQDEQMIERYLLLLRNFLIGRAGLHDDFQ